MMTGPQWKSESISRDRKKKSTTHIATEPAMNGETVNSRIKGVGYEQVLQRTHKGHDTGDHLIRYVI